MDQKTAEMSSGPQPAPEAPPQTPVSTPAASARTPAQTAASQTNSFHPTIPTTPENQLAAALTLQPGSVLDGYVIVEKIDHGGMGIVFKARQPGTERLVALKVLRDAAFA